MTTIAIKAFSGEIPNLPAYSLPDYNAQQAINCDFAQKDLRPLRDGLEVGTLTTAIKGIYTEDGIKFFSWATETAAFRSPTVNDTYSRVYFMNAAGFRVTQSTLTSTGGGEPSSSWTVGVPAPTVKPTLTLVDRTSPKSGNVTITATAWYELNGTRYDSASVSLTQVTAMKVYTFTPPTRTAYDATAKTGTPPDARLTAQVTITDSGTSKQLALVNVTAGATNPAKTSAFPGDVEFTLSAAGRLELTWGVYETRAYIYTVVNTFKEESAPSPAETIDVTYLQDVRLTLTVPTVGDKRPLEYANIYRTFGTSNSYVRVTTTQESTTSYLDLSYKAADVGVSLPSLDWYEPVSGMFGLTPLPNGFFAAFKDNVLYFSEPYRAFAWPYSMSFPKNIRGICAGPQSLVVTTADQCYIVTGATPKNMQQMLLPLPQAGVSHRSMTNLEGGIAFASNDGIVMVNGSQASLNISQQYFSREDWRTRYSAILSDIRFAYHDGFLVAVSSSQAKGFIVRMDESPGAFTQYNQQYDSTFYLPVIDTLYYSKGGTLYRFRAGNYMTLDWWSKDYILGKHTNFGACYIRCSGSVTVTLYADGAQWYQFTASSTGYYRLPAGNKALKWSVRLQTSNRVEEFVLAETMGELRSV